MKHAMVVNIQNHGLRSMLICLGSGLISTRIAIAAAIFVIINRVVSVSRLNSRMKQKPASPKHVSKPNAGLNNNCLFQSPSLSMRLASARPGRIATKPRDITSPRPSSLQTYLRRMMNQGRLEVNMAEVIILPDEYWVLISQGVRSDFQCPFPYQIGRYDEVRPGMYTHELFGGERDLHVGIDIGTPVGEPVHAFSSGVVHSLGVNEEEGSTGRQ